MRGFLCDVHKSLWWQCRSMPLFVFYEICDRMRVIQDKQDFIINPAEIWKESVRKHEIIDGASKSVGA